MTPNEAIEALEGMDKQMIHAKRRVFREISDVIRGLLKISQSKQPGQFAEAHGAGERPNVALALTPTEEWSERYRRALRLLCPQADAEALNPDNDVAMQSRMMGDRPEVCARYIADEIIAWSSPNAEVSESGDENQKP